MKKLISAVLASSLILTAGLTGCSKSNNSSGSTSAAASGSTSAVASKTTITFMTNWPQASATTQYNLTTSIINSYEAANPNVTINLTPMSPDPYKDKLKILASSNQLPDVGQTWAAGFMSPYISGGLFADLTSSLAPIKDTFVSGTLDAYSSGGKSYAAPLELNITPIYYNKAIFAKYGLAVPTTFDQFKTVCATLQKNGLTPIALGNKDTWTGALWFENLAIKVAGPQNYSNAVSGKIPFTSPDIVKAATEIQDLAKSGAFIKGFDGVSDDQAKADFTSGQAAMYLQGTWDVGMSTDTTLPSSFTSNMGFFNFPTYGTNADINSWIGGPGVGLFVANNSKVKTQAEAFVAYFVQKWGQSSVQKASDISASKVSATAAASLSPMYQGVLSQLSSASSVTLFSDVQLPPAAGTLIDNSCQGLLGATETPLAFCQAMDAAIKAGN